MRPRRLLVTAVAGLAAVAAQAAATAEGSPPQNVSPSKRFTVTLRWVGPGSSGGNEWELDVENTNTGRYINSFRWSPPAGLEIKAVTGAEGGHCSLAGGDVACAGNIAPEACMSCEGGTMTIHFTGNGFDPVWIKTDWGGYWFDQGWTPGTTTVTSTSALFGDLPVCGKGQVATKRKPCAKP
jgi:hypothetical protein